MFLFMLMASLILGYGLLYGWFTAKKSGMGAALKVVLLWGVAVTLLGLMAYYRGNT